MADAAIGRPAPARVNSPALALQPAVVLMDEPFSTLDITACLMRQQLAELWQESGRRLCLTHFHPGGAVLANRVYVLTQDRPGPGGRRRRLTAARYEDPTLTELEAQIVDRVMSAGATPNTLRTAATEPR
jgi:ABC-type nitrate/sulfonate/bicarbonate transport system ATPase subunit